MNNNYNRILDLVTLEEAQSSPSFRNAAHAAEHQSNKHSQLASQNPLGKEAPAHRRAATRYGKLSSTAREGNRVAQNKEIAAGRKRGDNSVTTTLNRVENEFEAQNRADKPAARQGRQTDDTRGEARPSRHGGIEAGETGRSNPESVQKQHNNYMASRKVRRSTRHGSPNPGEASRRPRYAGVGVRVRPDKPYTIRGKKYGGAKNQAHLKGLEMESRTYNRLLDLVVNEETLGKIADRMAKGYKKRTAPYISGHRKRDQGTQQERTDRADKVMARVRSRMGDDESHVVQNDVIRQRGNDLNAEDAANRRHGVDGTGAPLMTGPRGLRVAPDPTAKAKPRQRSEVETGKLSAMRRVGRN
jgi:hypothetical protein